MQEVEVANLAIVKIGGKAVSGLSDKADVSLENTFNQVRDRLLQRFDWTFAKARAELFHPAYAAANALKITMNAHAADAVEHTSGIDNVNFPITTPNAHWNTPTLYPLVGALLTAYAAHYADAELGAGWAFHAAQETDDHSIDSVADPTTLAGAVAVLEDLLLKYNRHDFDTSHGSPNYHPEETVVTSFPEWDYAFALPVDFLGKPSLYGSKSDFVIEGTAFLCNDEVCYLKYTRRVTDPTKWSGLFIQCFVLELASELAVPISNDRLLKADILVELKKFYLDNMLVESAEQNQEDAVEDTSWQTAGR